MSTQLTQSITDAYAYAEEWLTDDLFPIDRSPIASSDSARIRTLAELKTALEISKLLPETSILAMDELAFSVEHELTHSLDLKIGSIQKRLADAYSQKPSWQLRAIFEKVTAPFAYGEPIAIDGFRA